MTEHTFFHQLFLSCPVCQNRLGHVSNKAWCSHCGNEFYDNPAPCVSLILVQEEKVLLAKRKIDPMKGTWDVIGGFVDAGETLEEAALREMKEETGADAEIVTSLGSTPDIYGGRPTIACMYLLKLKDPNQKLIPQDDISELQWFSFHEIPQNISFKNVTITIQKVQEYLQK